ncbi:MAG: hypothetical protein ABI882_17760, partial [Acidobacteriota bacterium]
MLPIAGVWSLPRYADSKMKVPFRIILVLLTLAELASIGEAQIRRQKPVPQPTRVSSEEAKRAEAEVIASRAKLLATTQTYKESLEQVLSLQKQEEKRAAGLVEMRKGLLELGIISRREVEESESDLAEATQRIGETSKQIEEADQLVTEVLAAEQIAKVKPEPPGTYRTGVTLIRYTGTTSWSLDGYSKIDTFFRGQFGRSMPISAFGQSGTHDRLGFNHRGAMDVAVHPDTVEGRSLMAYLRSEGIPF